MNTIQISRLNHKFTVFSEHSYVGFKITKIHLGWLSEGNLGPSCKLSFNYIHGTEQDLRISEAILDNEIDEILRKLIQKPG